MQLRYPTSFLKLLLIGSALAAAPLMVALADAYFSLEHLLRRSEAAVVHAVDLTRDSRLLGEDLVALERAARQQLVLDDPSTLEAYAARREQLRAAIGRLRAAAPDVAAQTALDEMTREEEGAWQKLKSPEMTSEIRRELIATFVRLTAQSAALTQAAELRIHGELDALRAQTASARYAMLLHAFTLIPSGLLLTLGMALLIRRPVRELGDGLRSLGEGRFDVPIVVHGPGDLVELGAQLDWLRLRLSEVETQKTRFLQHVSHELKTPLTALQEGTQLLADGIAGPLASEQREIVDILLANTRRLRQLIENLLDYSGLRFGNAPLQRTLTPVAMLFAQVASDQKLPLAARQIRLVSEDNGVLVEADADKLRVVLDNLLSNAIKFAPRESSIVLSARSGTNDIVIEVADTGAGLGKQDAQQLFQPFVQGNQPAETSVKGSGLGLSIVRELVSAHGGSVQLLPNHPTGTRARVTLPNPKKR